MIVLLPFFQPYVCFYKKKCISYSQRVKRIMCGIFGCILTGECDFDIAQLIYLGLIGLQHRGQEGAGIVVSDGKTEPFKFVKEHGLVNTVFTERSLASLGKGNFVGVGHTRYSTAGAKGTIACIQPFIVHTSDGLIAIAHNGELINAKNLRQQLMRKGVGLSTDTDSEVIAQLLSIPRKNASIDYASNGVVGDSRSTSVDWMEKIKQTMGTMSTSYSMVIMTGDTLFAARDPYGNRPLCIGKLTVGGKVLGYVVSSETCAFNAVGAQFVREVEIGEIVEITQSGLGRSAVIERPDSRPPAFCIFEYVYFAKSDSVMEGQQVYRVRYECGIELGRESPVDADVVSTVPDSATPAALGYSFQTGIPYMEVLSKNTYIGRSFIQPSVQLRQLSVTKKFGPLFENFRNKRVVLIDDSIVRGTTMQQIVKLLKAAGATEVHIRVASPPIRFPCYMGINIPTKEELIANVHSTNDQLTKYFGADSVEYLTVDGLVSVVERKSKWKGHCVACLTGDYPVELDW